MASPFKCCSQSSGPDAEKPACACACACSIGGCQDCPFRNPKVMGTIILGYIAFVAFLMSLTGTISKNTLILVWVVAAAIITFLFFPKGKAGKKE